MDKKTIMLAIAAIAVVGLAFSGLYLSEDSDAGVLTPPETAGGTNTIEMKTQIGADTATKIVTAYGPLDDAGIFNQGVWYVAKAGTGKAYDAFDSGSIEGNVATFTYTNVDGAGLELTFEVTREKGQYTTEISASGITKSHDVYAAFCIASFPTKAPTYAELTSNQVVVQQWKEYKISITKTVAAEPVPIVFDKSPTGFNHTDSSLELKTAEYVEFDIRTAVADSPSLQTATWYANGLPAGLTMSPNGTIFGYLSNQVTMAKDVYLSAVVGMTLYDATIKLSSSAPSGAAEITLGIESITGVGTPTLVDMGSNTGVVNRYVTVGTGTLTVNLTVTGGDNLTGESFGYRVIAKDGADSTYVTASCTGNALTIDYKGSGEFIVLASYAGNETVLMQLVSVAPVQDVVADIQFNVTNDSHTA